MRKEADNPDTEATRRKKAAKKPSVLQAPLPVIVPLPPTPPKTLPGLFQDAGFELEGEAERLVGIIQSSLEDVLNVGDPIYRRVLNDIESRLTAVSADE